MDIHVANGHEQPRGSVRARELNLENQGSSLENLQKDSQGAPQGEPSQGAIVRVHQADAANPSNNAKRCVKLPIMDPVAKGIWKQQNYTSGEYYVADLTPDEVKRLLLKSRGHGSGLLKPRVVEQHHNLAQAADQQRKSPSLDVAPVNM